MLSHVRLASIVEALVEQILSSLNFPNVHPIGMSQQFGSQRDNLPKILYVQGSRICSLFGILLPQFHRALRTVVHIVVARRYHASLDPRLAGILFPEEL